MTIAKYLFFIVLCVFSVSYVSASMGDRSNYYQICLLVCNGSNCTKSERNENVLVFKEEAGIRQDVGAKLLGWGCEDECKYYCMWRTVDWFAMQNVVPKFHGKWPFYRLLGVQEPASAVFSILNLVTHTRMHSRMRAVFAKYDAPFKTSWNMFAAVCIHAWFWSTVFHTRDTPFTEFMDYTCALSMVLAFYASAVVRVLHQLWHPYSALVVLSPAVFYFLDHTLYLWSGLVDYDMNMALNIGIGAAAGLLWILFSIWHYYKHREDGHYVWRITLFTLLSAASLALEVFDFPPLYGVMDAHALWHLSTAPLPLLFYGFLIEDLNFIMANTAKFKEI